MDVRIDKVQTLPPNTFISVRYGDLRRIAPLRAGEVLSFPPPRDDAGSLESWPKTYKVDVFHKVASQQISIAGIVAHGGTVETRDLDIPSLSPHDSPIRADLCASMMPETKMIRGGSLESDEAARSAKRYVEEHDVQSVMRDMFAKLLDAQPANPLAYMEDLLKQRREEVGEETRREVCAPGLGGEPLPGFDGPALPDDLSGHHSYAAEILRETKIFEKLVQEKTALGTTLSMCVKAAVDCPGHALVKVPGSFAGDGDCYDDFWEFFSPLVERLHPKWSGAPHPEDSCRGASIASSADPFGRHAVLSTIEVRRNFSGIRFTSCCSKAERRRVEELLNLAAESAASSSCTDGQPSVLWGGYLPLRGSHSFDRRPGGMTEHQEKRLRSAGMLFGEPDSRLHLSAGIGRDWPDARGVLVSEAHGFYCWCNEEDHLHFFARQKGCADLGQLWSAMAEGVDTAAEVARQHGHEFCRSARLGYITMCPSGLGCALRVTVSLKLPLLSAAVDVAALCRDLDLGVDVSVSLLSERQRDGEDVVNSHGRVWNFCSGNCLGTSEVDVINGMMEACNRLIFMEQQLECGKLLPDELVLLGHA